LDIHAAQQRILDGGSCRGVDAGHVPWRKQQSVAEALDIVVLAALRAAPTRWSN
jgi:hypothetical protein